VLNSTKLGIDAGGTLIKIAYSRNGKLEFIKFPTLHMEQAVNWIQSHFPDALRCITGGKGANLQRMLGQPATLMVEFEATCKGVIYLMDVAKINLNSFILTNVGTGTSIHYLDDGTHRRIGGTGVGGGTLLGLSALVTGHHQFNEIVQLAAQGEREEIDLKVSHIYEEADPPIPGNLTASNFGRLLSFQISHKTENLLASIMGLVGETVATVSVHAAGQCNTTHIIYIGSSFIHNPMLAKIASDYTQLRGAQATFLPNGEYSGAVGALLTL
jgi:type II pantothenate kinase